MDDAQIHQQISALIQQERRLRDRLSGSGGDVADQRADLRKVEESLDQCWDLLRQRQALREFGENPDDASARSIRQVEGYQQ
jgi:hypothetical protein